MANAESWSTDGDVRARVRRAREERGRGPGLLQRYFGHGLPSADGKAFADESWSANTPSRDYWGKTLHMLSLLHLSGNFKLHY